MDNETVPASILAKHPEMIQIAEALDSYRKNRLITTKCPECDQVLTVIDLPEIGSQWVKCPNGHINFHTRYEPGSISSSVQK
jgi:hypothetical protein